MDMYELAQGVLVTTGLVFGRLGPALARRVERPRSAGEPTPATDTRVSPLEDECALLRREPQERRDFTERLLLRDGGRSSATEPRMTTPH